MSYSLVWFKRDLRWQDVATNSVNTALGGMFVPMVSTSPSAQAQLVK
jgi:hypothetical protein